MINDIKVKLKINKNKLIIKINERKKSEININNKTINTKEIYNILNYKTENKYILDCERLNEEATIGKDNEINRLYNYVYDLFKSIISAVNEINQKI